MIEEKKRLAQAEKGILNRADFFPGSEVKILKYLQPVLKKTRSPRFAGDDN